MAYLRDLQEHIENCQIMINRLKNAIDFCSSPGIKDILLESHDLCWEPELIAVGSRRIELQSALSNLRDSLENLVGRMPYSHDLAALADGDYDDFNVGWLMGSNYSPYTAELQWMDMSLDHISTMNYRGNALKLQDAFESWIAFKRKSELILTIALNIA